MTADQGSWDRDYRALRPRTLAWQLALLLAVEAVLFQRYDAEQARFHWSTHFLDALAFTNCGYCFPCLIRRAALATVGWDTEEVPWDVLADSTLIEDSDKQRGADLRAVLNGAFAERPDSDLFRNAPLPPGTHAEHLEVWRDGNQELRTWLTAGATGTLAQIVGRLA